MDQQERRLQQERQKRAGAVVGPAPEGALNAPAARADPQRPPHAPPPCAAVLSWPANAGPHTCGAVAGFARAARGCLRHLKHPENQTFPIARARPGLSRGRARRAGVGGAGPFGGRGAGGGRRSGGDRKGRASWFEPRGANRAQLRAAGRSCLSVAPSSRPRLSLLLPPSSPSRAALAAGAAAAAAAGGPSSQGSGRVGYRGR